MKTIRQFLKENATFNDVSSWKQESDRFGSNPGGIHTDQLGQKHYIKLYKNPDQVKVEYVTNKIYNHMGINVPSTALIKKENKIGIASKWNDELSSMSPHEFQNINHEQAMQLGKMYHAAVLTKNWDIVGLEHDNILKDKKGNLHSIDHGGTLHFRAQGANKDYGNDIHELHSLRNDGLPSGHVFNHVFNNYPNVEKESLESVKNINPQYIKNVFKDSGLHNHEELSNTFLTRREKLLNHYENN